MPLAALTELIYLNIGMNPVEFFEPLASLTALAELSISSILASLSLKPLTGLTGLERLSMSNTHVEDMEAAAHVPNVTC